MILQPFWTCCWNHTFSPNRRVLSCSVTPAPLNFNGLLIWIFCCVFEFSLTQQCYRPIISYNVSNDDISELLGYVRAEYDYPNDCFSLMSSDSLRLTLTLIKDYLSTMMHCSQFKSNISVYKLMRYYLILLIDETLNILELYTL